MGYAGSFYLAMS